jgi:viroplasmin and RNaseH domain-containing protein
VAKGKDGPAIYGTWFLARQAVDHFPKAVHKSFETLAQARTWLDEQGVKEQDTALIGLQ